MISGGMDGEHWPEIGQGRSTKLNRSTELKATPKSLKVYLMNNNVKTHV